MFNVLLVDDEENLLEIGREFLGESGDFNIITASSVDQALEMKEKYHFDAIVSDYQMPLKTGIDLLLELRARRDVTPFILFTGKGREEVVIEAINQGADYYVKKGTDVRTQYAQLSHSIEQSIIKRQAIEAVDYNLTLFKELIENSLDIIVVFDEKARIEYISPSVTRLLGYPEREAIGRFNKDFIRYAHFKFIDETHRTILSGGYVRPFLLDVRRSDGSFATMEVIGKLYERNGRKKVIVNARDVTERVERDRQLKELMMELDERDQLMNTHIGSNQGMVILTMNDKMLTLSPRASQLFGMGASAKTVDLGTLKDYLHPDDLDFWMDKQRYLSSVFDPCETKYRVRLPNGEIRHHLALSCVRLDENLQPESIISFISDITDVVLFHDKAREIKNFGHD